MLGAEETTKEIDIAREEYRVVATRGSILYFVVADFALIDPMYQFSLDYFKQVFSATIVAAPQSDDPQVRLQTLLDECLRRSSSTSASALFEKHKSLFAFLIAVGILRQSKKVSAAEWAFFLKAGISTDDLPAAPGDGWLEPKAWAFALAADEEIEGLKGLKASLSKESDAWRAYFESDSPQTAPIARQLAGQVHRLPAAPTIEDLPSGEGRVWDGRVCCVRIGARATRSRRRLTCSRRTTTRRRRCRSSLCSPRARTRRSTCSQLAKSQGYTQGDNLKMVSLGQGQGPIAERLMAEGTQKGHWVCLQNCHLCVSWLPTFDRLLEQLREAESVSEDYRLWLTTMPTPQFPSTVLQSSLKLTQEPPKGLKANLGRSYIDLDMDLFEGCKQPAAYKNLLFGLCFFNAVIQERRKYGAIGWNIAYQWMTSDLNFAQANLKLFLDEQPNVPWEALNVIISDVIYGGRVTDKQDVRLTRAILGIYMTPQCIDDPNYSYCPELDASFRYAAPPEGEKDTYSAFISTFPLIDRPEIFGLHQNADITFQTKESNEMLATIISLQPRTGGGGGAKTSDEVVGEAADDLAARLPKPMNIKEASAATFAKLDDGSMNTLGIFLSRRCSSSTASSARSRRCSTSSSAASRVWSSCRRSSTRRTRTSSSSRCPDHGARAARATRRSSRWRRGSRTSSAAWSL